MSLASEHYVLVRENLGPALKFPKKLLITNQGKFWKISANVIPDFFLSIGVLELTENERTSQFSVSTVRAISSSTSIGIDTMGQVTKALPVSLTGKLARAAALPNEALSEELVLIEVLKRVEVFVEPHFHVEGIPDLRDISLINWNRLNELLEE